MHDRLPHRLSLFGGGLAVSLALVSLVLATACTRGPHVQPGAAGVGPLARVPVPGAPVGVTAFVNVDVAPMDSARVLADQTVLVQDGWITALGPANKIKVPAGALRIDGRNKYLMPGLADMHAHLPLNDDSVLAQRMNEHALLAYVAIGVTTVRNVNYHEGSGPLALALRARAASGELLSPRIYTSGLWGKPGNPTFGSGRSSLVGTKPEEVPALVASYKAAGYDHLKVHEEIDPATEQGRAIFDSLVTAARRVGLPLVGHVALEPGWFEHNPTALRSIEHLTAYISDLFDHHRQAPPDYAAFYAKLPARVALTKRAGVWNCPCPIMFAAKAVPSDPTLRRTRAAEHRIIKMLQDSGARLLLGTDVSMPSSMARHLEGFVNAGLTPYQALLTGTRNVAEYYGTLGSSGTVAVGKRADLVLLAGNPLTDIGNVASPVGVMLGGRWLARAELDRRLAALATGVGGR